MDNYQPKKHRKPRYASNHIISFGIDWIRLSLKNNANVYRLAYDAFVYPFEVYGVRMTTYNGTKCVDFDGAACASVGLATCKRMIDLAHLLCQVNITRVDLYCDVFDPSRRLLNYAPVVFKMGRCITDARMNVQTVYSHPRRSVKRLVRVYNADLTHPEMTDTTRVEIELKYNDAKRFNPANIVPMLSHYLSALGLRMDRGTYDTTRYHDTTPTVTLPGERFIHRYRHTLHKLFAEYGALGLYEYVKNQCLVDSVDLTRA